MLSYCLKCKKKTENKNPRSEKTKTERIMLSSNFAICGSKKSRFIKEHEARGLLRSLGIKTPLSQIPIVGSILF